MCGVERIGLDEITENDPDDEDDGCCEPAEGGDPDRHAWSVSDRPRVRRARISLYEIREDRGRPHVGALPSGRVDAPSRLTRRRLVARRRAAGAGRRAAPRELWPGVTYESGVQFTTHGPVAINVLRGPRPGGLTTLEPVLSNDTVVGRERLTTMEGRLRRTATAAGVNGDYFTLATASRAAS